MRRASPASAGRSTAQRFDVAIVNAGVSGARVAPLDAADARRTSTRVMRTNVLGPMRVLPRSPRRSRRARKLAVLSSRMGSIGGARAASSWLYRASKAALNSVLKDAALTSATARRASRFHPGWVRTDMGGAGADIDVETSVAGMRRVIATLERRPEDAAAIARYRAAAVDHERVTSMRRLLLSATGTLLLRLRERRA